jgi:hypothetical protein
MKKIKTILLIGVAVLVMIQPVSASLKRERPVAVPSKYKNLFVFKADKDLVGAKVEVLYANGDVVTSQTLQKRKMIINFCDVKSGAYTIRIIKGDRIEEFQYDKK